MNVPTISGAAIAAIILFFTGFLALLQQDGVTSIGDINQVAWIVLGVGALVSFLKDFQALSVRRGIGKLTGTTVKSPWLIGLIALFLSMSMLSGCATQRPKIDSMADAIVVTSADIESTAQIVKNLCRNIVEDGPCAAGSLISTSTKDSFKRSLQEAQDSVVAANRLLAAGKSVDAGDRLAFADAIILVLVAELERRQR